MSEQQLWEGVLVLKVQIVAKSYNDARRGLARTGQGLKGMLDVGPDYNSQIVSARADTVQLKHKKQGSRGYARKYDRCDTPAKGEL